MCWVILTKLVCKSFKFLLLFALIKDHNVAFSAKLACYGKIFNRPPIMHNNFSKFSAVVCWTLWFMNWNVSFDKCMMSSPRDGNPGGKDLRIDHDVGLSSILERELLMELYYLLNPLVPSLALLVALQWRGLVCASLTITLVIRSGWWLAHSSEDTLRLIPPIQLHKCLIDVVVINISFARLCPGFYPRFW